MRTHRWLFLVLWPFVGCSPSMYNTGIHEKGMAVFGDPQAAASWQAERERCEAGSWVDYYGLATPRNVPSSNPTTLTPGSVGVLFDPDRSLFPVAVVATLAMAVPVRAVVFLERCSAEDLSAAACWARWEHIPWNRGIGEGAPLAFQRRSGAAFASAGM